MTDKAAAVPAEAEPAAPTRDQIRSRIFSRKPKSKVVHAFDMQIEVRQPPLGTALAVGGATGSNLDTTLDLLISCCFVPGTNESVFEIADRDSLKEMPFSEDLTVLTKAITELTGGEIEDQAKKS